MEIENSFDMDSCQVVRREFLAHTREPAVTFCTCRFYVNAACLGVFPESDTVQVMVNPEKHLMALTPCPGDRREALLWCLRSGGGKRRPRRVACRLFFAKICSLMDWDPSLRYRILGRTVRDDGQKALLFDLDAAGMYSSEAKNTPRYPEDWREQFGPAHREYRQLIAASLVDGYTVYAIAGERASAPPLPGSGEA